MCPDIPSLENHLYIKNGYSNQTERISFSIDIIPCEKEEDDSCQDADKIELALSNILFTLYYLEENIDFGTTDNLMRKPVSV